MQRTLHLTLHREFFAAIANGSKKIEYRDRTLYWEARLEGKTYDVVKFRNGYATNAPEMIVRFLGMRKRGGHYEILLGRILSLKRWARNRSRSE